MQLLGASVLIYFTADVDKALESRLTIEPIKPRVVLNVWRPVMFKRAMLRACGEWPVVLNAKSHENLLEIMAAVADTDANNPYRELAGLLREHKRLFVWDEDQ